MTVETISFGDGEKVLNWIALTDALAFGHTLPKATVADSFLYRDQDTLLTRSAWIDGLGLAIKAATIFPGNGENGLGTVNRMLSLLSDHDGTLEAMFDFHLVTKWKTAGDSLLAARHLARPDSQEILIVGAGAVAASLRVAYGAIFPDARFAIWNRSQDKARSLAQNFPNTVVVHDLESAVRNTDIVTCATLKRAKIFTDSRETTLHHIGEFAIPLAQGSITEADILADFYQLPDFHRAPDDITLFKNGGGAHLDLMTARHILTAWRDAQ